MATNNGAVPADPSKAPPPVIEHAGVKYFNNQQAVMTSFGNPAPL